MWITGILFVKKYKAHKKQLRITSLFSGLQPFWMSQITTNKQKLLSRSLCEQAKKRLATLEKLNICTSAVGGAY
jgi:hypothetical protein